MYPTYIYSISKLWDVHMPVSVENDRVIIPTHKQGESFTSLYANIPRETRIASYLVGRQISAPVIATLTALSPESVLALRPKISKRIIRSVSTIVPLSGEESIDREGQSDARTDTFVKALLAKDLIREDLKYWEELHNVYKNGERDQGNHVGERTLPANPTARLALETYVRARRGLRVGDSEDWESCAEVTRKFEEDGLLPE